MESLEEEVKFLTIKTYDKLKHKIIIIPFYNNDKWYITYSTMNDNKSYNIDFKKIEDEDLLRNKKSR